jgi:predicted RNase H-like HicB family nuclease
MRYAMIIEQGERNYSAYLPDLPGCIASGKTVEERKQRMSETIELHLRGMREAGYQFPSQLVSPSMSKRHHKVTLRPYSHYSHTF